MPVCLESLDPTQWEPHAVFRETYLCLRLPQELADLGRHLGWQLYRETLQRLQPELPAALETLPRPLMAAARDLRQLEGFLGALGRSEEGLSSTDQRRAQMARHVAESLARLALTLEAASR